MGDIVSSGVQIPQAADAHVIERPWVTWQVVVSRDHLAFPGTVKTNHNAVIDHNFSCQGKVNFHCSGQQVGIVLMGHG